MCTRFGHEADLVLPATPPRRNVHKIARDWILCWPRRPRDGMGTRSYTWRILCWPRRLRDGMCTRSRAKGSCARPGSIQAVAVHLVRVDADERVSEAGAQVGAA